MEFRVYSPSSVQDTANISHHHHHPPTHPDHYSPLVCYSYTLNTILGVGCLTIPYAVYHAGLVLGLSTVVGMSFLSYVTVLWTCEALERHRRRLHLLPPTSDDDLEVVTLCRVYLGSIGANLYHVALYSYGYAVLVAFAQVFIAALSTQFPALSSSLVALFYSLVVVPLSCMDLTEQIVVQLFLTSVRFAAITLMTGSLLFPPTTSASSDTFSYDVALPLVNFDGLGLLVSTVVFAQFCHMCVPSLIAPLKKEATVAAPSIFLAAMTTTTCIYVVLAVLCAISFGPQTLSSVNLNWSSFPSMPLVVRTFLVLFPAIDTLSSFPLIAINVGNSIEDATSLPKLASRLAAAVPPILLGYAVNDLSTVVHVSGVFGVYLVLIGPALLQWTSLASDPEPTRYACMLSHIGWVYIVLVTGAAAVVILAAQVIS
ncbi:hypothetical protein DYB28_007033 [Aphanomyces astaci]|uniref:Amino acid transporter transmembrane domain-containing protein n=1 Tax=Aphanomyces astaci TaxID=112090 RepID=A0A397AH73_APHAT|nr:hypothetical protein DYB36_008440 [Aphanomyces astaci]RHZ09838.1 hypothetical protein DYB26_008905 [Aphanomyces astaci]RLO07102.1 hypothetical protein DYB28_007033 [Aphanomyces astaci]